MPGGRPRKPDEMKILDGTWRDHRDGKTVPVASADGEPEIPKGLKGEARSFWKRVVPGLVARGIAKAIDATQLAIMCEWWAEYQRIKEARDNVLPTAKEFYPLTVAAGIACTNFDKIAARFAMTPSDRAKLRVPMGEKRAKTFTRPKDMPV